MTAISQLDHELLYAPGFPAPPNTDFVGYRSFIDENLPPESPYLYGLHPNAEIGFLTQTSENLFRTVLEMQPRDTSGAGAAGTSREEKVSHKGVNNMHNVNGAIMMEEHGDIENIVLLQVKSILDEFLEKLPEEFNMMELFARAEEKTPYVLVALQECERMNGLTREMKRSLKEVDLGLKV